MKAAELEDLKVCSDVLNGSLTTISVLISILESEIRDTRHYIKFFKEYVNGIKTKQ